MIAVAFTLHLWVLSNRASQNEIVEEDLGCK